MVDCHARPSPRMGHRFAHALEPYGLYWLEEPCWPERVEDMAVDPARASRRRSRPASGWSALHAFRELLETRACSVIQPDITHCGGLTEARRIAALAEAYRVAIAPHNPQGPVSTAASIEFGLRDAVVHHLRGGHRATSPGARTWCRRRIRSTGDGMRA